MYQTLRILHIVAGSFCLLSGIISFLANKWSRTHQLIGKSFILSMFIVAASALCMTFIKPNIFLTAIALFSLGLVTNGWIAARIFKGVESAKALKQLPYLFLLINLGMVLVGIFNYRFKSYGGILLVVFGLIGLNLSKSFIRTLRDKTSTREQFFKHHVSGMIGGFISAVTAFAVNTIHIQPNILVWLAPSVILVPLLTYIARSFAKKNNLT